MGEMRISDLADGDGPSKAPLDPPAESKEPSLQFLADLIRATTSCSEIALFEYGRASRRQGPGTPAACSPQALPDPQSLKALLNDPRSQSGPSDCFSLGVIGNAQHDVVGLRLSNGTDVFVRGYVRFEGKPSPQVWNVLRQICLSGAGIVSEIRSQRSRGEAEAARHAFQSRMFEALRLGSDAYW